MEKGVYWEQKLCVGKKLGVMEKYLQYAIFTLAYLYASGIWDDILAVIYIAYPTSANH